jgi:hypothetical protein
LDHGLRSPVGKADDWTLGEKQKKWLFEQLSKSKARWKFLLAIIPLPKAGVKSTPATRARRGAAAQIGGVQAILHGWMKQFGVQAFFFAGMIMSLLTSRWMEFIIFAGSAGAKPEDFLRSADRI